MPGLKAVGLRQWSVLAEWVVQTDLNGFKGVLGCLIGSILASFSDLFLILKDILASIGFVSQIFIWEAPTNAAPHDRGSAPPCDPRVSGSAMRETIEGTSSPRISLLYISVK